MALSKTTRDHDEIRKWAEERGAIPAEVKGTERGGEAGILRFEFPKARNHNDDKLEEIEWEDFFEKFDANNLELLYQEVTADGEQSNFNKLIHPESEEHSSHKSGSGSGTRSHSNSGTSGKTNSKSESKSSSGKKHEAA